MQEQHKASEGAPKKHEVSIKDIDKEAAAPAEVDAENEIKMNTESEENDQKLNITEHRTEGGDPFEDHEKLAVDITENKAGVTLEVSPRSDKDALKGQNEMKDTKDDVVKSEEAISQGQEVTEDVEDARDSIAKSAPNTDRPTVFLIVFQVLMSRASLIDWCAEFQQFITPSARNMASISCILTSWVISTHVQQT